MLCSTEYLDKPQNRFCFDLLSNESMARMSYEKERSRNKNHIFGGNFEIEK